MFLNTFWENKGVVVTGGSRGLGKALVEALSNKGARVVAVARDSQDLRALEAGGGVHTIAADVANKQDIYRIAGEAVGILNQVDVLINNASALGPTPLELLADAACEDLTQVLETNVLGPFRLTKALVPGMLLSRAGLVVNISSDAAVSAYPTWGLYGTSKAALDQLSRIFDAEVRSEGVRVLSIDPGDMNTAMHLAAIPGANVAALASPTDVARGLIDVLPHLLSLDAVRYSAFEWQQIINQEVR